MYRACPLLFFIEEQANSVKDNQLRTYARMANSIPSNDHDLMRLSQVLMPHIVAGRWHICLALTWLYMVRSGGPRLSSLSMMTTQNSDLNAISQLAVQLNEARSVSDVDQVLDSAPCRLMTVFDYMLMQPRYGDDADAAPTPSFAVYHRESDVIELLDSDLSALGIPAFHRRVYLVAASNFAHHLKALSQEVHQYYYTPNWWVVPEAFDDKAQGYRLKIHAVLPNLFSALLGNEAKPDYSLRVYAGEYINFPEYVAQWNNGEAGTRLWVALTINNEQKIGDEAIDHLRRAKEKRADVVLLPELCSTPAVEARIVEWLENENGIDAEQMSAISMVIAGSRHLKAALSNDFHNVSMVFDGSGERIAPLCQQKLTRVSLANLPAGSGNANGTPVSVHVVEHISTESEVGVLATPIGLHANVICLDLGQGIPSVKVPIEQIPLAWLWVPSLSKNTKAHQTRAKEVCLAHPTRIACANQGPVRFDVTLGDKSDSHFASGCSFAFTVDGSGTNLVVPTDSDAAAGWMLFEFDG